MRWQKRNGVALVSTVTLFACLLLIGFAGVQLLMTGVRAWQKTIAVLVLDNNGQAACRAIARECSFQLAELTAVGGNDGVAVGGRGISAGRTYRFFRQASPENGRQTLYRSVAVNNQAPGVNPLTDPHSVEVVFWRVTMLSEKSALLEFQLRENRWGKVGDYHVLLTAHNVKNASAETVPF